MALVKNVGYFDEQAQMSNKSWVFVNWNRIYQAHQTNVWCAIRVFHLHWREGSILQIKIVSFSVCSSSRPRAATWLSAASTGFWICRRIPVASWDLGEPEQHQVEEKDTGDPTWGHHEADRLLFFIHFSSALLVEQICSWTTQCSWSSEVSAYCCFETSRLLFTVYFSKTTVK